MAISQGMIKKKGILHYTVRAAAKILKIRSEKVRELMGNGTLEWDQTRTNGQLIVTAKSLMAYCKSRQKID